MLSYRHGYHAGNHADVLKHWLLVELLHTLCAKPAPFFVLDTHAGAGVYDLQSPAAVILREFDEGIGSLWQSPAQHPAFENYLRLISRCNQSSPSLRNYPGSPWLIAQLRREQDRAICVELHSHEAQQLQQTMGAAGISVRTGDGWKAITALTPPKEKRGLVFIDPSYEMDTDWREVESAAGYLHRHFRAGIVMIWYPILSDGRQDKWLGRMQQRNIPKTWHIELRVGQRQGMCGSGVIIINPPWGLSGRVVPALPQLVETLAQDSTASVHQHWLVPE